MPALSRLALCLFAAFLPAGCASSQGPPERGGIDHVVFVWLKNPANAKESRILVDESQALAAAIPQIRSFHWGTPVPSERRFVDDTYDLALVMNFADRQALKAYEDHPAHTSAAKEVLRPLARKVVVYDIERN